MYFRQGLLLCPFHLISACSARVASCAVLVPPRVGSVSLLDADASGDDVWTCAEDESSLGAPSDSEGAGMLPSGFAVSDSSSINGDFYKHRDISKWLIYG